MTLVVSSPSRGATPSIARHSAANPAKAGSRMPATRRRPGEACLSSSSHLPPISGSKVLKPVMLAPGRDRLSTMPEAIGSALGAMMIGIVVVAFFAARIAGVARATMRSTLRCTRSAAIAAARARSPSAQWYSSVMVCPSIQPSTASSSTSARTRSASADEYQDRMAMRGRRDAPLCATAHVEPISKRPAPIANALRRAIIRSPRRRGRGRTRAP